VIAFDSNLFIYVLDAHEQFGAMALDVFLQVEKEKEPITASEMVLFEALAHPDLSDKDAKNIYNTLFDFDVTFVPIHSHILLKAAKLRRTYHLGSLDAIHVASAIHQQASHFITNDLILLKKRIPDIKLVSLQHFGSGAY
jgi:predicted nucleic acid-binding protein